MTQQPTPEADEPHVCKPGATVYYCPTVDDTESDCHGGFDVCCSAPDLHQQVLKCSLAHCRQVHPPHSWEPQPGMKPVHCEGFGIHRNEPMEVLPIALDRTKVMQITATNVTSAASITIPGTAGPLVTISPDGRLEYGPGYEPDEAARLFWDAVRRWAPSPMERQFGRPLTERINTDLARGQAIEAALGEWLPVLRRAVESLPATCMYHDETHPHGSWREACCDTGIPARRRELAEKALAALTAEETE